MLVETLYTQNIIHVLLYVFVLINLIVASELPDADEEGGSDGEEEFGASILVQFFFNNDTLKWYLCISYPWK